LSKIRAASWGVLPPGVFAIVRWWGRPGRWRTRRTRRGAATRLLASWDYRCVAWGLAWLRLMRRWWLRGAGQLRSINNYHFTEERGANPLLTQ